VSPGSEALRVHIARYLLTCGCVLSPDQIVITTGCQEALMLSLRAVCRPGDTVAVESPTYFNFLQAIETLGLRALEIPTHPREGMEMSALHEALAQHPVRACLLCCNFGNPLGSVMPEEKKRELVALLAEREIPLIEDDLYGDLSASNTRPGRQKRMTTTGWFCIAPPSPRRWRQATASAGWRQAVFRRRSSGGRRWRTSPPRRCRSWSWRSCWRQAGMTAICAYPAGVCAPDRIAVRSGAAGVPAGNEDDPSAGWVRPVGAVSESVDALKLYTEALAAGISIAPGPIFSPKLEYRQCIRLHAAHWSPRTEAAIERLGQLAKQMASG